MAWIEQKQRRDGGVSARVVWRLGGTREGAYRSGHESITTYRVPGLRGADGG